MKLKSFKRAPVLAALAILALVCGLRLAGLDFFERLERMTDDLRARTALHFPAPAGTNLAFVSIEESSIAAVENGSVGFHFGLYWPREVYGRLIAELSEQGAKDVAFDVLFNGLRPDHPPVQMADGGLVENDDYFARQMRLAGNVILADAGDASLPELFVTNALALGDVTTLKDSDGVLRRVRAFRDYRRWHPLFQKAADQFGLGLADAKFAPGKIILPQTGTTNTVEVPVDAENNFYLTNFVGDRLPPGVEHANIGISLPGTFEEPKAPVYVDGRLFTTLKGDRIVAEFIEILDEYVDSHYAAREAVKEKSRRRFRVPFDTDCTVDRCALRLRCWATHMRAAYVER